MRLYNKIIHYFILAGIIMAMVILPLSSRAEFFNFSSYQHILDRYLHGGIIIKGIKLNGLDYKALYEESRREDSDYRRLLQGLRSFNPETLKTREEKIAFWINVYNIGAIKMILDHYPVDSIRSMKISFFKNPWGKEIINVGGRWYSLGEIEHEILIGRLKERKIHFAIVCASLTCPDLSPEVYAPEHLTEQLRQQAISFINNPRKGYRIDRDKRILYVSNIFGWDKKSFRGRKDIISFILPYIKNMEDREFIRKGNYSFRFLPYDWSLNEYSGK